MWGGGNDTFGGGGFLPQSQSGNSPAVGGPEKSKLRRANNIIPITVRQILKCQDDTVRVGDIEANVLTIVGLVTHVETTTTKVAIHVDDQTGVIECVNYVGVDASAVAPTEIPFVPNEGTYGRVVGAIRQMKGVKYLVIYKFIPLTDMNELTAHLLEVVLTPLKLKKLKEAEALKTGIGAAAVGGINNTLSKSMVNNFGGGVGASMGMMGGTGGARAQTGPPKSGIQSTSNMVLSILQSRKNIEDGMHKDDIMQNMKGKVSTMAELEKILENLGAEGLVYSTVDEDHFRSTD